MQVLLAQVRIFVSEIRKGGPVSSSSGQGGDAPPEASASKPGKPAFSAEPKVCALLLDCSHLPACLHMTRATCRPRLRSRQQAPRAASAR